MNSRQTLRILVTKAGLDGHDRGAKVLSALLREAGFEVIYLGLYNTPAMVVKSAIQEDVDVIGVSFLSGGHLSITAKLMVTLKKHEAEDIPVIVGGIMPVEDEEELMQMGVRQVFIGAMVNDVIAYIEKNISPRL